MLTRTKRFIISSGSFDNVQSTLSGSFHTGSAVTSSCNWADKIWCDITYTFSTGSDSPDDKRKEFQAAVGISKVVWKGVRDSGELPDDVQDIGYV